MTQPIITEKDLKFAVEQYLEYGTNQGKWYADRLQAGEVIEVRGKTRRRVKLCRIGTADFYMILNGQIIFLECKGEKGRQSPAQKAFEKLVKEQQALYYIISSVEELDTIVRCLK